MKTKEELATKYLRSMLGSRRGLDYRDVIQDEEIEKEVEVELSQFIAAIQLDAQRAAYAECAEIAKVESARGYEGDELKQLILAARNNLKLP